MKKPDDTRDATDNLEQVSNSREEKSKLKHETLMGVEPAKNGARKRKAEKANKQSRKKEARSGRARSNTQTGNYVVGYGKPPLASQYKPGQSGNLKGRPRKNPSTSKLPELWEERFKVTFLSEIYRMIPVQEGERTVEIPIIQGIIKRLSVSAIQGDHKATKLILGAVKEIEEERYKSYIDYIQELISAKFSGEAELERCKKLNLPPPELIPHPNNILLDALSGRLELIGPFTKEEKERFQNVREIIEELEDEIAAKIERGKERGVLELYNAELQKSKLALEEFKLKVPLIVRWIKNGAH
jgi:hypothetical protein